MVQLQLKRLGILIALVLTTCISYGQGPPRLRFTQLPQADSIGSILITDSDRNLQFTNNLRYLNSVFSVTGDVNFDSGTFFVDNVNNRVGIGTSSPNYKLHIEGSGTANEVVGWFNNQGAFSSSLAVRQSSKTAYLTNHNGLGTPNYDGQLSDAISWGVSSSASPIQFWNGSGGVGGRGTAKMTILESGNVGIGTTSPSYKLDVNGSIKAISATANNGSPYAAHFFSGDDRTAIWRAAINLQHNPDVTIVAGSSIGIAFNPLSSTGSSFYGSAAIKAVRPNATANNQDTDLAFWTRIGSNNNTSDSEKMRITGSGNVGIGTTSPVNKLDVRGIVNCTNSGAEATLQEVIRFARSDYPDFYHAIFASTGSGATRSNHKLEFRLNNSTSNGLFTSMTLVGNGNVGIGTTTPSYKLDVYQGDVATTGHSSGDLRLSGNLTGYGSYPTLKTTGPVIYFEADNTYTGYIGYNTGFIDVSDGTLKTFVEPIQNATDILMNLEGVRYSWIDGRDDFETHAGFVAQQVLEHYPEAVTLSETGMYGISSPPLIALAVTTIQEQQAIIETQNTRITELETALQALITRVEQLENQ